MAQPASLPSIGNNPLPFRLVDLPPELFSLTCSFLNDESLLNLRQASRSTHGNAWHTFGERCFSTLHIFLHPVSLGMFLEIASHAKLSKHVKEVSICLESIDNVYYDKTPEGAHWKSSIRRTTKNPLISIDSVRWSVACEWPIWIISCCVMGLES
jgi:hypothetical protein